MIEEKFVNVIQDFENWCVQINSNLSEFNRQEYSITEQKMISPELFKNCKYFLTSPVGIFDHKPIEARSCYITEQEVKDFVDESIIPYMYINQGDRYILRYYKMEDGQDGNVPDC